MSPTLRPQAGTATVPADPSSGHRVAPISADRSESLLATAAEAARAAADIHRQALVRGGRRRIASKSWRNDFVTDVDLAAQAAALAVIRRHHPNHAILAEEEDGARDPAPGEPALHVEPTPREGSDPGGELAASNIRRPGEAATDAAEIARPADAQPLWIVDPLDGTTNFMHGHPFHAASVAVRDSRGPLAAAIHAQALDRVWTATRGGGAFENGRPIRVSSVREASGFLVGTGFPFKTPHLMDDYLHQLGAVLRATSGVRRAGAAAIDLAWLANGILDGFWEMRLAPWDFAAGELLVAEAGGVVERIEGGPLGVEEGSVLAANSAAALSELRKLLRRSHEPRIISLDDESSIQGQPIRSGR